MKKKTIGGFIGLSVGYTVGVIILQILMFVLRSTGNLGLSPEAASQFLVYGPYTILIVFSIIGVVMGVKIAGESKSK